MRLNRILIAAFLILLMLVSANFTAWALDTSTTLWTGRINITNLGLDADNTQSAQFISGSALIDSGFMEADTLNAVVHQGTAEIPSMPPNFRIAVEGMVLDDGGSFTEFTTPAANAAELDTALLPISPAVSDAAYFGFHNPGSILTINIGQEGIGDWALDWEYWDGTSFTDLSNVVDNSNAFKTPGLQAISWDMPTDMATRTITGSAVDAFWVRAVVDSVTTSSQQAIGNQVFYENGQWWMWIDDIDQNDQIQYDLSMGGADLVTRHQIFPGTAGITTADDSTIELGGSYAIVYEGMLNATAGVTGSTVCLVCKSGAFAMYLSADDTVTMEVTGSGNTTLSVNGIDVPSTGDHTVNVFSDGTDVTLEVVGYGSDTGTAQVMTDNSNDWEIASNASTVYLDALTFATPGVLSRFNSQADWNTGTLTDIDSNSGSAPGDPNLTTTVDQAVEDVSWGEGTSSFFNNAQFLRMGFGTGGLDESNIALGFNDIQLAQGEEIATAVIRFTPQQTDSATTVNLLISAVDEDDAAVCASFAECEGETLTTAQVAWSNVPTFTADTEIESVDITSVIQEIVDRAGWASGNDIVIHVEDNGSTAVSGTERMAASVEDARTAPQLIITKSGSELPPDDFISLAQQGVTTGAADNPIGWVKDTDGSGGNIQVVQDHVRFGQNSIQIRGATTGSGGSPNEDGLSQNLAASAGQVWSVSAWNTEISTSVNARSVIQINWLDASLSTISTVETVIAQGASLDYQLTEINGETAPANTAWMQVRILTRCTSASGCNNNANLGRWDAVMACICATAATFPDSDNLLTNPDFELLYSSSGTWESPTANPTATNVLFATASWSALTPTGTTLTAETSIDGGSSWQAVTNGGNISGISIGDDLSSTSIDLRFSLSTTDQELSPIIGLATINITDFDESSLRYALNTTPGVTIEDLSPNTNAGTMSYPVQSTSLSSTMGPLTSTRSTLSQREAIGDPEFASDVTNAVTGSAVSSNIFGEETGSDLPLFGLLSKAATDGDVPIQVLWGLVVSMLTIAGGALVFRQSSSLLFAGIFMGAGLCFAASVGTGLIPAWTIFLYVVIFAALLTLRPRMPT